jgi:hypothetical protein
MAAAITSRQSIALFAARVKKAFQVRLIVMVDAAGDSPGVGRRGPPRSAIGGAGSDGAVMA